MVWSGHRLKGSMMQAIHFGFSLGAAIGPLVAKPFLPDLEFLNQNCTRIPEDAGNSSLNHSWIDSHTNVSESNCPDEEETNAAVEFVRFAYVTVSSLVLIPMGLYVLAFFLGTPSFLAPKPQKQDIKKETSEDQNDHGETDKAFRVKLLVCGFFLFFLYQPIEGSFANFSAVFVVKGLGWSNGHGSLITSLFWAALGIGRGLGIPVAAFLTPARMLVGMLGIMLLGAVLFIFSPFHDAFVWIAAAVAGMGMAPFFGTAFVWVSQYVHITGRASAVFLVATSVAGIANPYIVGYLMDNVGHMALPYYITAVTVAFTLTYVASEIYVTYHNRRKKGRPNRDKDNDVNGFLKETEMTLLSPSEDHVPDQPVMTVRDDDPTVVSSRQQEQPVNEDIPV